MAAAAERNKMDVKSILHRGSTDQLKSLLKQVGPQNLGPTVSRTLRSSSSSMTAEHLTVILETASQLVSDLEFKEYFLPHCPETELETLLTMLVSHKLWQSVSKALEESSEASSASSTDRGSGRGRISESMQNWVVLEASLKADDSTFLTCILPRCSNKQLETVKGTLMDRGMWESFNEALARDYPETQWNKTHDETTKMIMKVTDEFNKNQNRASSSGSSCCCCVL